MQKIIVSGPAKTNVTSEDACLFEFLSPSQPKPRHLLPAFSIEEYITPNNNWEIVHKDSEHKSIYINDKTITYSNKSYDAYWDVLHLLQQTSERQFQENGFLTLHSSAVCLDEKGVLFLGDSNAGKTALTLNARNHNFKFISNERTLLNLNTGELAGGTDILVAKKGTIKSWVPWLNTDFEKYWVMPAKDYFKDNIIAYDSKNNIPLRLGVFPKLNSGFNAVSEQDANICKMRLYKDSSTLLAGNEYMMFNLTKPSLDFDTPALKNWRADKITTLLPKARWLWIEGSPQYILKTICDYLNDG